jgi:hypothetical protein
MSDVVGHQLEIEVELLMIAVMLIMCVIGEYH